MNAIAIVVAAYFLLRLFKFTLTSVAAPALLLAMFCTESVTNTLVFTNINGCILLLRGAVLPVAAGRPGGPPMVAGVAIGLTLVIKPSLAPLLLLPLLNRQWRALVTAFGVPLVFNAVGWPLVSDPMGFVRRTVPYIFFDPRLLQQLDPGQRQLLRSAAVADPVAAHRLRPAGTCQPVAAVPLLP